MGDEVEKIRKEINCTDCLNALAFCFSPRHQFDVYWRDGVFETCEKRYKELRFCFALKSADPAKAKEMLKELAAEASAPSPTEGTIWEPRPGSDPGVHE